MGAARLPERSASRAKTQPARPVAATVPNTDSPVRRASGMCVNPKVSACSSLPPVGPNASAASVASAPRKAVSSDHTVPSGISTASQWLGRCGRSRSAIAARTFGIAALTATPAATAPATARPTRSPGRSAGGRRPNGTRTAAASTVP